MFVHREHRKGQRSRAQRNSSNRQFGYPHEGPAAPVGSASAAGDYRTKTLVGAFPPGRTAHAVPRTPVSGEAARDRRATRSAVIGPKRTELVDLNAPQGPMHPVIEQRIVGDPDAWSLPFRHVPLLCLGIR
jgi:hypothetical protein